MLIDLPMDAEQVCREIDLQVLFRFGVAMTDEELETLRRAAVTLRKLYQQGGACDSVADSEVLHDVERVCESHGMQYRTDRDLSSRCVLYVAPKCFAAKDVVRVGAPCEFQGTVENSFALW